MAEQLECWTFKSEALSSFPTLTTSWICSRQSEVHIQVIPCYCERFEPRSHFKSRLSLIIRVNVVLNRTVLVTLFILPLY